MPNGAFHRSADVVKTHSEVFDDSPPPRHVAGELLLHSTSSFTASLDHGHPELEMVRHELEQLKRRRAELEAQRQRLLDEKLNRRRARRTAAYASGSVSVREGDDHGVWSTAGLTSTQRPSDAVSAASASTSVARHPYIDSTVLANMSAIPSEQSRQRHLKHTPQLDMKSAIREAAKRDSTLLMGDFLPEDNPRTCTFGRERRFRSVVGQRGKYYLSTDVGVEQLLNRDHLDNATYQRVAQRYDQTPGPGAYTPRYSKLSHPPRFLKK